MLSNAAQIAGMILSAILIALQNQPSTPAIAQTEPPQEVIVRRCKVVGVYDGDTMTVDVTHRIRVRLLDCWAPELREPGGMEARDYLRRIAQGKHAVLTVIPSKDDIGDTFSFGRILGRINVDGADVSEVMVRTGHATKERN